MISYIDLSKNIIEHLKNIGSIDVGFIDGKDIPLKLGLKTVAHGAIYCKDKSIYDLFKFDPRFEKIASGNLNCYGLPYSNSLILLFDTNKDEV